MDTETKANQNNILNLFVLEIKSGINQLAENIPVKIDKYITNNKNVMDLLKPNLESQLLKISECTLLAHYMAAESEIHERGIAQKIEIFCESLLDSDVREYFFKSFPILFGQIGNEISQWSLHSQKLIKRFVDDHDDIIKTIFKGIDPGKISRIVYGLGDKHNKGETVTSLLFDNGDKLIYIPRKRNLHSHFLNICNWLDGYLNIGFRLPETIISDSHTWVEFIENETCTNSIQIEMFYERSGIILSLLYALDATDFHYENVIASGEYPVLIDLESFFHPFMPFENTNPHISLNNTVLNTGLLPAIHTFDNRDYYDLSGLSDIEGTLEMNKSIQFILDENGNLKSQRKKGRLASGKNIPQLYKKKVELTSKYSDSLKKGFCNAYKVIQNNKNDFVKLLDTFRDEEIRIILRHSSAYSHLLKEGRHPDLMRNIEVVEQHYNWLNYIHKEYPIIDVFVDAEKEDLHKQNIPYFYSYANSRDLWHFGKLLKKDFFNKTGLEVAKEKVEKFSDEDLDRQCWIIDMCLSIRETGKKASGTDKYQFKPNQYQVSQLDLSGTEGNIRMSGFLNTATKLADHLIKNMKITEKDALWLVLRPMNLDSSQFEVAPASYDLYSGMPGEIICFSVLSMLTGNGKYSEIAYKALNYLIRNIDSSISTIRDTGIFGGWGSIIYLMAFLSKIKGNLLWTDMALSWIKKIKPCELSMQETNHGLVNGSAGFIIACLSAYKVCKNEYFLQLADKMSGILMRSAFQSEDQIKWKGYSKHPLAGLSHGASGYAICFARLYNYTGTKKYKEIVMKILNYENHLYDNKSKNWPDLRDFVLEKGNGNTHFSTAWSHGAPGIGLARIELLRNNIKNKRIIKDLEISIETCLESGFGGGHNLCFGDLGNLELLINGSIFLNNEKLKITYQKIADCIIRDGMTNGFKLSESKIYSPGLMSGITGVIYQCLRVYNPEKVPSILSLSV